jgi:hypothetical protein
MHAVLLFPALALAGGADQAAPQGWEAAHPRTPAPVAFDLHRARKGVSYWPKLDGRDYRPWLQRLKARGYDHVGLVFEPNLWQNNKGGIADFDAVRHRIEEALWVGMKVVVRTQPWSLKYSEMFRKDDPGYFDAWIAAFAREIGRTDPDRVAWEVLSEPGWYTRDTSKLGLGGNDKQRPVGTRFLHRVWDHIVPLIRRYAPHHTLYLGLPGWGHSYGANEHLEVDAGRFPNAVHYFHFYWPFEFTHDRSLRLSWPEPRWRDKLRGKDLKTIAYGSDHQPWDRSGLAHQLDKIANWGASRGVPVHVTEAGPVYNRETPAGKAYRADLERGLEARGIPYTIWIG